jgi:Uncharacterised nucleotidyltransferase
MSPPRIAADSLAWRAQRLRLDVAAAEAFACFERAGVRALLLKGRSISGWLYGEGDDRPQIDCDLLVAPSDLVSAERILLSLGYRRYWDDRRMPSWWREHAGEWLRDRDRVVLDVHRALPGIGVAHEAAWTVLSRDPATLIIATRNVPVLGFPARTLHIVLHAAHHGAGSLFPIEDLGRALRAADSGVWRAAAELARELDALDAFTAGLQLHPDGLALARSLGLPSRVSTQAALRASAPPPLALGFEQVAQARGIRARIVILARKLVPPADFMRHWDPRAARSRSALIKAYLRRPLWLLRLAPRGLRAWWRARARA